MTEPNDVPPDELVGGKYRLTRLLGRGGMGSVWEGVHASLGTHVAVKFIESEYADSAEARSRFENEARAAARLLSKHVVKVFDHGVMTDGRPYIVMEYLSGEPLDVRLARTNVISLQETAQIVVQVARALTKAHEAGIVHRDLKPENVFLVRDDEDGTEIAKVVDFGIAKFTDGTSGLSSSTRTGSILGTPYYMSPEQARGLRGIDHRSDLWSLVVIAYRAVVGRLPFMGEAVGDLLVQICTSPAAPPSTLVKGTPPGFDAWVARGLAKEPAQRFQTAAALADALAGVAGVSAGRPRAHSIEATLASSPHNAGPMSVPTVVNRVEGVTAAPFTTQNTLPTKKSPIGLIVAAAAAGLVVLGVVGVVALRAAAHTAPSGDPVVAVTGGEPTPVDTGVPAPKPAAPPSVAPAVDPPPSASAEPDKPTTEKHGGGRPKTGAGGAKPTSGAGGKTGSGKPGGTDVGY
ncbi:MAG: serine/threonine-protein kinase [Polyangiaceae bacterium]